jgi:hypothetical protein
MEAMQKSIDRLTNQNILAVHQSPTCAICGESDHLAINCNWGRSAEGDAEQVNAFNNNFRPQNNPYSNTYNHGWRNHPNFYQDNQPQNLNQHPNQNRPIQGYGQRQFDQGALQKSNMEQMMEKVMHGQEEFMQDQRRINQQVVDQIKDLSIKIDLLTTQGKMLETQVTQLATPPTRQQDMQMEHVKAVFSRNECEEGKTKPQENEIDQAMTREISDSQKQVKEDVSKYVSPLRFVHFPQRLVKPDLVQ